MLQLRERKIKPWSLFILPLILGLITIQVISSEISSAFDFIIIMLGFLVGTILGLIIGRFMDVKTSASDDKIILKGSRATVDMDCYYPFKDKRENILNNARIIKVDLILALFLMITLGTVVSRRMIIYWKYLKHKKTKEN